jgi:tRNA-splicing ligase RtcB
MTAPGFIVRGSGNDMSLQSASHGAGRLYSRRKCKENFTGSQMKQHLKNHDVTLIGGGIDEAPMAYKNIKKVMGNQLELVEVLGTFTPKIVRMAK